MKRTTMQKILSFLGGAALALLVFFGGNSLLFPEPPFAFYDEKVSSDPGEGGAALQIREIERNPDGSGAIRYTLSNLTDQPTGRWLPKLGVSQLKIDYLDQDGSYHTVYPRPHTETLDAGLSSEMAPGEIVPLTETLPEKTLSLPGRYRFCVSSSGFVPFEVKPDGTVEIEPIS